MAKGKLYEYAVIYHPKAKKDEDPTSTIIVEVTRVLATSDQQVAMLAARAIPAEYVDKLDLCEVVVRPF